ncbi:hypothetical protein H6G66_20490 [Fischerella sp. FACHB-380]|nr:hypothetical protein [Fischerella sp. FACHB-380]
MLVIGFFKQQSTINYLVVGGCLFVVGGCWVLVIGFFKQQTTINKQQSTNNNQQTTINKQQSTNNNQQTTI